MNKVKETKTEQSKTIKLDKNQTMSLYQNKERELQGLSQRIQQIDEILNEMSKADSSLKEIEKLKTKEKILINVGAGILVECEVSNKSSVKVMLPGQIMTDKSSKDTLEDIKTRRKELEDAKEKLIYSYNQTAHMLEQISVAFRELQIKENQKQNSSAV